MLPVLIFTLVGAMLIVGALLALMFWSVAFQPPRPSTASHGKVAWILPLLQGEDLRKWANRYTQDIVARHTRAPRGPETAVALSQEVECAVTTVLDRVTPRPVSGRARLCPSDLSPPSSVTPPEALAIATQLQHDMPGKVLDRVRDQLHFNLAQLANPSVADGTKDNCDCPLLDAEGRCAAWEARPIHCRSHCPECVALGKPCAIDVGTDGAFALNVGQGVTRGLSAGLSAAGLDGRSYEFNSALLTALATPGAAARWAKGDPVFATCLPPKE